MDTTRSPRPSLHRLITHKFKVTKGPYLRSVKIRGTKPLCRPHPTHPINNVPGAPPHVGVIGLDPKFFSTFLLSCASQKKREGRCRYCMDTRPPFPRVYRLITHKFKFTRGPSLRSVKDRRHQPTSVCPPYQTHTRENLPGAPPHDHTIRATSTTAPFGINPDERATKTMLALYIACYKPRTSSVIGQKYG